MLDEALWSILKRYQRFASHNACITASALQVSMVDTECWQKMVEILTVAQQVRRAGSQPKDEFGDVHVILFGDFKHHPYFQGVCVRVLHSIMTQTS